MKAEIWGNNNMVRTHRGARTRLVCGCVIGVVVAAACGHARADSIYSGPNYYVSVGALYLGPDKKRLADYGTGGSLAYGYRLGDHNWIEGRLTNIVLETGPQTAIDFYQNTLGLDFVHSLGDENRQHFFVLFGGGVSRNNVKPDTKDATSAYIDGAVGWRINASENWGVRPRFELRYSYDTFDSGQSDVLLGVAFEIPPRTDRVVVRTVNVERIVEVPVEVEKIVEKEVGCDKPDARRPTAPEQPPALQPAPPPP